MTPLAASIAKSLTLPAREADPQLDIRWNERLMKAFAGEVHHFECSQVLPVALEFMEALQRIEQDHEKERLFDGRVFLPAPKTWIEWKAVGGSDRQAVLLVDDNDGWASAFYFSTTQHFRVGRLSTETGDFERSAFKLAVMGDTSGITTESVQKDIDGLLAFAHTLLVVINTPRIIGRRQVMPNRALERRLTRHFGKGRFPLLAWTEIELKISKPTEIDDGHPHEAHLTGRRALHFCRAHLRLRNGQIEYVSSHWRGDAAIGIKQSRYKVVA